MVKDYGNFSWFLAVRRINRKILASRCARGDSTGSVSIWTTTNHGRLWLFCPRGSRYSFSGHSLDANKSRYPILANLSFVLAKFSLDCQEAKWSICKHERLLTKFGGFFWGYI